MDSVTLLSHKHFCLIVCHSSISPSFVTPNLLSSSLFCSSFLFPFSFSLFFLFFSYSIVSSPFPELTQLASNLPLPRSEVPAKAIDTHQLLKGCQKLLYSVYHREMGWHPSSTFHSKFDIKEDQPREIPSPARPFAARLVPLTNRFIAPPLAPPPPTRAPRSPAPRTSHL